MTRAMGIISALALVLLTGCVTDQPSPHAFAPTPGQASITITRSNDFMSMGLSAAVELNGAKIASLGAGESYSGPVPAGSAVLTVSNWSAPGASSARFNAQPGKAYRFTITPRGAAVAAGLAGGIVGMAIEGGGPFQIAPAS
jgi:hypothetical protein